MRKLFRRYGVYIIAVAAGAVLTPAAIYTVQEIKQGIKIFREENDKWN